MTEIKQLILNEISKEYDTIKTEEDFNQFMENLYNSYDDERMISIIVSNLNPTGTIYYDYVLGSDGYNEITYWSKTIQKSIILDCDIKFHGLTLDEIITLLKEYSEEAISIEKRIKKPL